MAYDPTDINTTTNSGRVNAVRYLVGDTDTTDEQLTDDEINFTLSVKNNNIYLSASMVAQSLAAKYSRFVDTELEGMLKEDYSQKSEQYYKLAAGLRLQGVREGLTVGIPTIPTTQTPEFTVKQFEYPNV